MGQYSQGPNIQNQEWNTGLCSCSPCSNCLLSTCCPCILLGRTADRMRDPTMQNAETCNSDCMIYTALQCITGCGWIYAMMKRGEIRERFGIQGSGMNDCCVSFWCHCCALIQQEKEVQTRLASGPIVEGYQSQKEGMHVPASSPPPQPQYNQQQPQYNQQQPQYSQQQPQYNQQQQQQQQQQPHY